MSPHRPWLPRAALGMAAVLGAASAVRAEPAPSYPDLLKQAETTAPRLAESRAQVRQAQGLADQSAARPNPTVGVTVENFGGDARFAAISPVQTTLSIEQPIPLAGQRGARAAAGRAELDAARAQAQEARARYAYDLAIAFMDAEADDVRLKLAGDSLSMAQEDARAADALVRSGKEANVRGLQARAAVEAARAALAAAQAERESAFAKLTALAGQPRPLTSIPDGLLTHGDVVERMREIDPMGTPAYIAARAAREAAAKRVRVEQLKTAPDLTASLGVRQLSGVSGGALVAGLSAPLPLFDRNRGAVAAARAELAAADARSEAARLDAEAEARAGQARLLATETRLAAAKENEAAATEAYRLSRIGYEGGKSSLLELQIARRALTEARTQTLETRIERLTAEASLARLQGAVPFGDQ